MHDWLHSLDHTMPELIREAGRRYGAETFLVGEDGSELSFEEFDARTARVASGLLARGVSYGDRIAVWAPNSPEWVIAACAVQRIGAVLVPINTRFKGREAGYVVSRCRARAIFTLSNFLNIDYAEELAEACGGWSEQGRIRDLPDLADIILFDAEGGDGALWPSLLAYPPDDAALRDAEARVGSNTVCDLLFTSGTTGAPKGAQHGHGQALWMVGQWNAANDLRRGDRMLIINPFFHSFGYRSGWVSALMAGASAHPCAVFDAAGTLELIRDRRITVLMGAPTLFISLLDHPDRDAFDLGSLRVGHTGSANVPVDLIRRARDELGFTVFLTSFGLTESTALVSVNRPEDDFETIARTVGRPLPGVELRIIAPDGSALPHGEAGELLVRGPNVMLGYFEDAEATASAIDVEGFLHTGDVGVVGEDGLLRIVDRLKDVVIVGGFNAYPAEIETVLREHPAIAEVAVVSAPDDRMGEVCAACIILQPGADLTLADLTDWSRSRLANFKIPRHLLRVGDFPRTPLGKVQKYALRQRLLAALS